jgi:hypothetical protein
MLARGKLGGMWKPPFRRSFHLTLFGRVFFFELRRLEGFELGEYQRYKLDPENFRPYTGR